MEDGRTFRPSDWVDRLSATLASFGPDQRLRYGAVRPCFIKGKKCLMVQKTLETEDPTAFEYVNSFARSNGLRVSEIRRTVEESNSEPVSNTLGIVA